MADLYAFRAKSATFGGVALNGVLDGAVNGTGSASDLNTDADPTIKGTVVDGIAVEATVTVSDAAGANTVGVDIGEVGDLVIVFERRADGKGAAASPNRTATLAGAVCLDNGAQAASQGIGSATLRFRAKSVAWS